LLTFQIDADQGGQRLDKYLRRLLPQVPLSHVYKMVRTRKVRVNGRRARGETILAAGDVVTVRGDEERLRSTPAPRERKPRVEGAPPLSILHEDDDLIAVDKPSGLAVHPGSGIVGATLVDLARAHAGVRPPGAFQVSPAHRLDKDTSGVVLVAKSRRAMVALTEMFTAGKVHKEYLALVKGRFASPQGTVDIPLVEHEQTAKSRDLHGVKLQGAVTRYRVMAAGAQSTLLSCTIETGRTHQIRRHLAAIGHPLLGDRRYGDFALNRRLKAQAGLDRLFLHARRLALRHPVSGVPLDIESPFPPALLEALRALGIAPPDKVAGALARLAEPAVQRGRQRPLNH
jgi:23S rRNA pseudouridine955/2504/2580 synthase